MGTEVHYKSSFPGYYSMREVDDDSNSSNWPLFYGDKALTNCHYYNGFVPRTITRAYPGDDKDALKRKMIEHEAVFRNQVYELHRVYRRQRDMMEEVRRRELRKNQVSIDTLSSSSLIPSQNAYEDGQRWHIPSFPLANATCARTSIFGVEISESPLSCSKGNSSKDHEVLEFRPSKVRKKLFDLQRPADEYIDPEETKQIQDKQASEISIYPPKDTRFRGANGLADLNEPYHVEEETLAPPSVDFLGPSAKPAASQFPGQPQVLFERSQNGFNRSPIESKGNGRDRFSYMHDAGNSRSDMCFTSHGFKSDKLHTPSSDKERQHPGKLSEISARIQSHSVFNQTFSPFATPHISSSHPFENSSDMADSWSPSVKSWRNPNGSLTHKLTSFPTHSSFLSSRQRHEVFGDDRRRNGCYGLNIRSGSDLLARNGFNHGSSSGSKEPSARVPVAGFGYRNCNKLDDGSQKLFKGSNFVDLTDSTTGIDLNTVQTLSNEDDDTVKRHETALPWLRAEPGIRKNGAFCDQLVKDGESCRVSSVSHDDSLANDRKILGFRIFGNSCISKNDSSSLVSTSASLDCDPENGKMKDTKRKGIDINVAWDDEETVTEVQKFKNRFDLNSCVTEDEDLLVTESVKSSGENMKKMAMEIDLEAPAVPEIDDDEIKEQDGFSQSPEREPDNSEAEEGAQVAAEAIVAISCHVGSTTEVADDDDPLVWFAELITSGVDEYESLTLQLTETKEEDYMPKPLALDFCEPNEAGPSSLPNRPRRGQARRGRPRRDFQRVILPGLVSLSRHEVTEDLQIFGGLMKATGHSWNVGLTKRKGNRQGRRKVVAATTPPPPPPLLEPLNKVVGLEERRLTGWGKTTRRPRRQRCTAGNSVTV